ncbi:MAG: DUF86 domain-containing protein [Haliscomenobacter sp.]|nr:DUF86 domain-containing protein [Haliscomenobacter sp.]MBK8879938.1 DUF86 domain-containing protein [Haliscomenobacter sp.]
MLEPRLQSYLDTIQECLSLIQHRLSGIHSAEDLIRNDAGMLIMDGIAIRLQLIGETVKKLDHHYPGFFASKGIDPKPIIRFRDFVAHHYDEVDYELLYDICINHLPALREKLDALLS